MQYNHRGSFSIREFRVYAICRITRTWEKRGFFFDRITRNAHRLKSNMFSWHLFFFNAVRIFIIYTRLRRLNTGKLLDDQIKGTQRRSCREMVKIVDLFLFIFKTRAKKSEGNIRRLQTIESLLVEMLQTSNYSREAVEKRENLNNSVGEFSFGNSWLLSICPIIYPLD